MTKTEMVTTVAQVTGMAKSEVARVIEAMVDVTLANITEATTSDKITVLPGLLSVFTKVRPAREARMGRNPATGENIKIAAKPATVVVKAMVHKQLKDAVEGMKVKKNGKKKK